MCTTQICQSMTINVCRLLGVGKMRYCILAFIADNRYNGVWSDLRCSIYAIRNVHAIITMFHC